MCTRHRACQEWAADARRSTTIHTELVALTVVLGLAGFGSLANADVLTWVGSGTNGNEAITPTDPGTQWSNAENWLGENAGRIPALNLDASGTDAEIPLSDVGRIYASALRTGTLTIDGTGNDLNWEGDLVFEGADTHFIGSKLSLTNGAVIRQDGGRVEFLDEESSINLQDGGVYRLDRGEVVLPGKLTLGSGRTRVHVEGGRITADEIIFSNPEADICVWQGGSLRVRSLVLETVRPDSCISGRLEVQQILANGGNLTSVGEERVGLVAPTDILSNRETAILQIDGDITFWGGVEWQLHGTEAGRGYDQIDARGSLTISGILDFRFPPLVDQRAPIYLPMEGDTFDVVIADEFVLTEIGLRLPVTARGDLFTGFWGDIGDRRGLRLIAQYDFRQALADFNGDQLLDIEDLNLITRQRGNASDDSIYDLDENGLVDETDRRIWIHQLMRTSFGDADLDGQFNSNDLVDVFESGKYEQNVMANWSEGDWNSDGVFGSGDLVLAFQDGGYEQGARATVSAVPEPSTVLLLAFAATLTVSSTRRKRF